MIIQLCPAEMIMSWYKEIEMSCSRYNDVVCTNDVTLPLSETAVSKSGKVQCLHMTFLFPADNDYIVVELWQFVW